MLNPSRDKQVSVVRVIEIKDAVAEEVEDEGDSLIDQLSKGHLRHVSGGKFCSAGI